MIRNAPTPFPPIFPTLEGKRRPKKHMELVTPRHYKGATVFSSHRTGHRWRQPPALPAPPTPPLLAWAPRAHSGRLGPQGRPSRWVPALTHRPQARIAPARGTQARGLRPPARAAATPPPHGQPAPPAPSAGRWPHLTRAVAGRAPASPPAARAHGRSAAARPRRPAAARFWGRALLGGGFPGASQQGY
ncbi:atherin-like [Lynx canadensis]|uniref:atherin-like n=1 Tax=Lynx canadensis TaxID=61383 RepID=UPI0011B00252|nr:atherin-like [Lynx canadensis]